MIPKQLVTALTRLTVFTEWKDMDATYPKADDYYFYYSADESVFVVVEKSFWHNAGKIKDLYLALGATLPQGFWQKDAGHFRYLDSSWDDGRRALIAAGFTEMDEPNGHC